MDVTIAEEQASVNIVTEPELCSIMVRELVHFARVREFVHSATAQGNAIIAAEQGKNNQ